jgi:hypothetical protein
MRDAVGYELSGASALSAGALERGLREFRCYIDDPVATVNRALADSPELVMAHVLNAYLHLLGTEPAGLPVARAAHASASALPVNDRERRHLAAVGHMIAGQWRAAGRALEDLSVDYPRDGLALQAGHLVDFLTGDSRMLRDRIARALPAWSDKTPGYHAVLGMHAFGLEETGDYARAEAQGRLSIELEPRGTWAQHAVAHVMEMQGRRRDGIAWMRSNPDAWSRDSFFAVHNWWHVALFHLGLGEIDEALAIYDGPVYGAASKVVLDMIDASAMLWRLHLRGINAGDRWSVLARNWEAVGGPGTYAFNDLHAVIAFVGAGAPKAAEAVLDAQRAALDSAGDNALFTREVGFPATLAIKAFGDGNYAETVRLLRPIRNHAHRFGGSHAQRDLIDLTLIAAASRAGQTRLAAALLAERASAARNTPAAPKKATVEKLIEAA